MVCLCVSLIPRSEYDWANLWLLYHRRPLGVILRDTGSQLNRSLVISHLRPVSFVHRPVENAISPSREVHSDNKFHGRSAHSYVYFLYELVLTFFSTSLPRSWESETSTGDFSFSDLSHATTAWCNKTDHTSIFSACSLNPCRTSTQNYSV
jgi:hypothetical protein